MDPLLDPLLDLFLLTNDYIHSLGFVLQLAFYMLHIVLMTSLYISHYHLTWIRVHLRSTICNVAAPGRLPSVGRCPPPLRCPLSGFRPLAHRRWKALCCPLIRRHRPVGHAPSAGRSCPAARCPTSVHRPPVCRLPGTRGSSAVR